MTDEVLCHATTRRARRAATSAERVGVYLDVGGTLLGDAAVLRVRLGAVHGDVEADLHFVFTRDDLHELFEHLDGAVAEDEGVRGAADDGEELLAEELASLKARHVVAGEDTDAERTEETTHTVDGPHVEGVVEAVLRELDGGRVAPRHAEDA